MDKIPKALAHFLFKNIHKPLLFSEEVETFTGYCTANVRTLYSRGHLTLPNTPLTGRGVKIQYSMFDVIEIMAYSELSRLGVHPSFRGAWKDNKPLAISIANCVFDHLRAMSGDTKPRLRLVPGKADPEKIPPGSERYVLIYFDESIEGTWSMWTSNAMCDLETGGAARVIIDCLTLAVKAVDIFAQYGSRL